MGTVEPQVAASSDVQAPVIDGFQLVIDALKLNGLDTIYGLPGIPITDLTRRAHPEEGTCRLSEPDPGNSFAAQAEARRNLEKTRDSKGQNSRNRARLVSVPTSSLAKNTRRSPCDTSMA